MEAYDRVIYKKNSLIEVIYQLRFPTILSINVNEPVDFQDSIRQKFPIYQLMLEQENQMVVNANGNNIIPSIVQQPPKKNHTFVTADGKWRINLTSTFISISTVEYRCWENLQGMFEEPLKKFVDLYKPAYYERIGLRYVNAFSKKSLNVEDKSWRELIKYNLLGCMAEIDEAKIKTSNVDTEYLLEDGISLIKVHAGLGMLNNSGENVFILDSDFYRNSRTSIEHDSEVVEYLHKNSTQFIRSAITETLHYAMGPEEI